MDTMFGTKIMGAVCGSLLIFLLVHWGAEEMYHIGSSKGHGEKHDDGHGDDHHEEVSALAWIVVEEGEATVVEEEPEVPFAEVFAAADAVAGERSWSKCRSCHKLEDDANGVGPYLYAVVNRPIGKADGFTNYSSVLADSTDVWSPENLNAFLESPQGFAPGTRMNFNGIRDVEERANLIAYLQTIGG